MSLMDKRKITGRKKKTATKTVQIKSVTIEDVSDQLGQMLYESRRDRDSKLYSDVSGLLHRLNLQAARQRVSENLQPKRKSVK